MDKFVEIKKQLQKTYEKLLKKRGFTYLYNKGIDFYNKKKYEKAKTYFKLAVDQPKPQPQAYYNLALCYQYLKEYERAIVTYNSFLALRKDDYDGFYNLALTYFSMENYEKAIEFFEKCTTLKKEEEGVKALTLAYLGAGEVQKAIEFAESFFNSTTEGVKLYLAIAKVFENRNSLNKDFTYIDIAIQMYIRVINFDPKVFEPYLSISICYAKKGEWENSVEFCKKALEVNPNSYEANNQMGLVYYCFNNIEEAIKYYEIALKLKPKGDYKIYSNLAYAYEKFGNKKKAIKLFNDLVNKFPDYPARNEIKNHLRILQTF